MDHAGSAALDFTWSRIAPGGFLAAWKVWDGGGGWEDSSAWKGHPRVRKGYVWG